MKCRDASKDNLRREEMEKLHRIKYSKKINIKQAILQGNAAGVNNKTT